MAKEKDQISPSVSVFVVDDDPRVTTTIAAYLKPLKCLVSVYADPRQCLADFKKSPVDIVISDLDMPEMHGIDLLEQIRKACPQADVIIVTGTADKENAIEALKRGAFDFFEKPVNGAELLETIKRTVRFRALVAERDRLADQVSYLSNREARLWGIEGFVGKTKLIKECVTQVRLLQGAERTSVLITGESGTGKELIARAVHFGGTRKDCPFVPINCSAVPAELAESTLFGHLRGAFTGANSDKKGAFDLADGGTLFLDEIGDMPMTMQAKLLRVLEDGMITPVGGAKGHYVDARVVAATNANLEEKIAAKAFRSDLYFRLAGFNIELPTLRERKADIPRLAQHFAECLSSEMGRPIPEFQGAAMDALAAYDFPGNVRELKNMVERAIIESDGSVIRPEHIHFVRLSSPDNATPASRGRQVTGGNLPLNLQDAEVALIRKAMSETDGNMAAAARILGINRTKLYRKLATMQAVE
jgi:DNA-binding NtrC family response regulator